INLTPWEADHPELQDAYHIFNEALSESFPPEILPLLKVILAVPTYSPDLSILMKKLPADGYSLGVLDPAIQDKVTQIFPINEFKILEHPEEMPKSENGEKTGEQGRNDLQKSLIDLVDQRAQETDEMKENEH